MAMIALGKALFLAPDALKIRIESKGMSLSGVILPWRIRLPRLTNQRPGIENYR